MKPQAETSKNTNRTGFIGFTTSVLTLIGALLWKVPHPPLINDQNYQVAQGVYDCSRPKHSMLGWGSDKESVNGINYFSAYSPDNGFSGMSCYNQFRGSRMIVKYIVPRNYPNVRFILSRTDLATGEPIGHTEEQNYRYLQTQTKTRSIYQFDRLILGITSLSFLTFYWRKAFHFVRGFLEKRKKV